MTTAYHEKSACLLLKYNPRQSPARAARKAIKYPNASAVFSTPSII